MLPGTSPHNPSAMSHRAHAPPSLGPSLSPSASPPGHLRPQWSVQALRVKAKRATGTKKSLCAKSLCASFSHKINTKQHPHKLFFLPRGNFSGAMDARKSLCAIAPPKNVCVPTTEEEGPRAARSNGHAWPNKNTLGTRTPGARLPRTQGIP